MMKCRVCNSDKIEILAIKNRQYWTCRTCGSICLSENHFNNKTEQKLRYEKHHNSISDDGYKSFLEGFIIPILNEIQHEKQNLAEGQTLQTILDYGSGPEPALCELLRQYADEGRYISHGCEIRGWDPFFAPDTAFFENGADLVTCLEVAEHFELPACDFKKLAGTVKAEGFAAIGTMLLPEDCDCRKSDNVSDAFTKWWYRSDSTHVTFYTLEGLKKSASSVGLEFVKAVTDRAFLFRKTI